LLTQLKQMTLLKNIFLVEDDIDDQFLFLDALKEIDRSISCRVAENGKEALNDLKRLTELPDLIFLDLNMPLMNGFECLGKLKKDKRLRDVPVVIFTTSKNPADAEATHQLGANVFFSKPSRFADLKSKLQRILSINFSSEQPVFFTQYSV
jgi:CheY-like chemotaxis protein